MSHEPKNDEAAEPCPNCGADLAPNAPMGLCPACLIGGAMEPLDSVHDPRGFELPSMSELAALFPQYEVLELIGRGGMGAVFKVLDRKLDRLVALKILPRELGSDPTFAERFEREARVLARLQHPAIVGLHDFGVVEGLSYLAMEFIEGETLRARLQVGLTTAEELPALMEPIVDGLRFAHGQGVIHRDIKPENLLVDLEGRVRVADFGLAQLSGSDERRLPITGSGHALGTPHYMAPEQLEAPQDVDERSDIYSVGVVMYELLTGRLPIGVFSLPASVGAELRKLVMRCLQREPIERFGSAGELLEALRSVGVPGGMETRERGGSNSLLHVRYRELIYAGLIVVLGSCLHWGELRSSRVELSLGLWNGYFNLGPLRIPNWTQALAGALLIASGVWVKRDPESLPRRLPIVVTIVGDLFVFFPLLDLTMSSKGSPGTALFVMLAGYFVAGRVLWQTRSRSVGPKRAPSARRSSPRTLSRIRLKRNRKARLRQMSQLASEQRQEGAPPSEAPSMDAGD